jgi:hypothetical protein
VHYCKQKKNQAGGLRQDACQIQPWKLPNKQCHFAKREKSEAAPPGQPKTEVACLVIAAEQQKEDQQNDYCSRFEESDSEQPLILQHHAPPPAGSAVAAVLVLPQSLM